MEGTPPQGSGVEIHDSSVDPEIRESTEIAEEPLKKDSVKKMSSPFRRISSPGRRTSRFSIASITSMFSRKSTEEEEVNLVDASSTSPTEDPPSEFPGEKSRSKGIFLALIDCGFTMIIIIRLMSSDSSQ